MTINFNSTGSQEIFGTDTDSESVFYNILGAPDGIPSAEHGSFELNDDGSYRYVPARGFFGIETLSYGEGQSMTLLVGPPEGKGLKDVVGDAVNSIGTTIVHLVGDDPHHDRESFSVNQELAGIDALEFSHFTPHNAAKWGNLVPNEGEYNFHNMDMIAERAVELGTNITYHAPVWDEPGGYQYGPVPGWLIEKINAQSSQQEKEQVLRQEIESLFDTVIGRYGHVIDLIDVVNEDIYSDQDGPLFNNIFGEEYINVTFEAAALALENHGSDARLAINEFNVLYHIIEPTPNEPTKAQLYFERVEGLINDGVDIDVVGMQAHLAVSEIEAAFGSGDNFDPNAFYWGIRNNIEEFLDLKEGLEVVISELDIKQEHPDYENGQIVPATADGWGVDNDFSIYYEIVGAVVHDLEGVTDLTLWGTGSDVTRLFADQVEDDGNLYSNLGDGYYDYDDNGDAIWQDGIPAARQAEYFALLEGLTGNSEYNQVGSGGGNSAPNANDDQVSFGAVGGNGFVNVLNNDSDPDGDALSISAINGVAMQAGWQTWVQDVGLVVINGNNSIDIQNIQNENFNFSYTISDGDGGTSSADVYGSIGGGNSAPNANDDQVSFGAVGGNGFVNVLNNDSDPDGDALSISAINGVAMQAGWQTWVQDVGLVVINGNNSIDIQNIQNENFNFSYTISDGIGGTSSADVYGSIGGGAGEPIYGTDGDDQLDGTDGDDVFYGYSGVDIFYGSSGNDVIYGQSQTSDEYNQVNYEGAGVSSSDFTFTQNEDGSPSVIATSAQFGQDTLYGIDGVYFQEDGWISMDDLLN